MMCVHAAISRWSEDDRAFPSLYRGTSYSTGLTQQKQDAER